MLCPICQQPVRIVALGWPPAEPVIGGHCVPDPSIPGAPPAMLCPGAYEPADTAIDEIEEALECAED